jgi:hypothetical protein
MSTDSETSVLFVFYNGPYSTSDKVIHFEVTNLPDRWVYVDRSSIPPCSEIKTKYTHYAYFKGPSETIEEVKKIIDDIQSFSIWGSYHIQTTFLPIPA